MEIIDHELSQRTHFTVADLDRYMEFSCSRYIRLLCRRGLLAPQGKNGLEERGSSSGTPGEGPAGEIP